MCQGLASFFFLVVDARRRRALFRAVVGGRICDMVEVTLLLGDSLRQRLRRISAKSKGDLAHLVLVTVISTQRLTDFFSLQSSCRSAGPLALLQLAPVSPLQVISSPTALRLAASSFTTVEMELDPIAFKFQGLIQSQFGLEFFSSIFIEGEDTMGL
jgi:hypothetical protein